MTRVHPRIPWYVQNLAQQMRSSGTEAERILWALLRGRKLEGYKFRRQCPLGRYIADFFCPKARLVIELDGGIHSSTNALEYDRIRDQSMQDIGIRVLRIPNEVVLREPGEALEKIRKALAEGMSMEKPEPKDPEAVEVSERRDGTK